MNLHTRRLGVIVLSAALVTVVALGAAGNASGKKKAKPLKVSCDQLYAEIDKTAAQLQAQYNAIGFTIGLPDPAYPTDPPIDGSNHGGACKKQGKRIRQGVGFMIDIHSEGEPPFPGETNPAVREYDWTWSETVIRTKKGLLHDIVSNFKCEKYIYDGSSGDPHNIQTFAC